MGQSSLQKALVIYWEKAQIFFSLQFNSDEKYVYVHVMVDKMTSQSATTYPVHHGNYFFV